MNSDGENRNWGDDAEGKALLYRLHQIAERLWATSNYVQVLQARLPVSDRATEFADKAVQQLNVAIEEFNRLRDWLVKR